MNLPVYHIDTSVILADMFEQFDNAVLPKLWQLSGMKRKFYVVFSSVVFGEVVKVLKESPPQRMSIGFEYLRHLFQWYNIGIYTPEARTFKAVRELEEVDNRLESMDAFVLASAITAKAQKFITLDSDFLNVQLKSYVRQNYNLTIEEPSL